MIFLIPLHSIHGFVGKGDSSVPTVLPTKSILNTYGVSASRNAQDCTPGVCVSALDFHDPSKSTMTG